MLKEASTSVPKPASTGSSAQAGLGTFLVLGFRVRVTRFKGYKLRAQTGSHVISCFGLRVFQLSVVKGSRFVPARSCPYLSPPI